MTPISILRTYWGFHSFKGLQEDIINSVVSGKDTLALLPTGGGKSICYQVSALMMEGLCLVITPLVALMKDQVDALIDKGIDAAMLSNSMNYTAIQQTLQDASNGHFKFLYISPERLKSNLFKDYIESLNIQLIAVDEAHCISQWGYDFRPSYISIADIREVLDGVPILAVTASATKTVQEDIVVKLKLDNPAVFQQSFIRPALSYSVFNLPDKIIKVFEILNKVEGSAIIYCRSRAETKNIAHLLKLKGISADFYHAGLNNEERSAKQQEWMNNTIRVIVATNAFGMGIDKADVRVVIHLYIPDCIESYYQEAGRAGRDDKKAYAVLVYNQNDLTQLSALSVKRYPEIAIIKEVYQSLVNYLQIAVGAGQGLSFDFDMEYFVTHFKLSNSLVINVLKILEQEGHILLSDKSLTPSSIQFVCDKEAIENVVQAYPELDDIIKALMRKYSGIFDNTVFIFEKQLASLCKLSVEIIIKALQKLQVLGIIEYQPFNNKSQILFLLNRASASQLYINTNNYLDRRRRFEKRLSYIEHYLTESSICRSVYMSSYFDAPYEEPCGVCDNCLNHKRKQLSINDFNIISKEILQQIPIEGISINAIFKNNKFSKEKFWEVIQFMEQQEVISSINGYIKKLKQ